MRRFSFILAMCVATFAFAKEPRAYQDGKLLQMKSVACGSTENEMGSKPATESLCQEYVIQTEQVVYQIRPKDAKHPVLLPVGEYAQFRLEKARMMLRVQSVDSKEHEYKVISIKPRGDSTADATPVRLNHLQ